METREGEWTQRGLTTAELSNDIIDLCLRRIQAKTPEHRANILWVWVAHVDVKSMREYDQVCVSRCRVPYPNGAEILNASHQHERNTLHSLLATCVEYNTLTTIVTSLRDNP